MGWQHLITVDKIIEFHLKSLQLVGQDPLSIGSEQTDCVAARIGNAWLAEQYSSTNTSNTLNGLCFAGYLMFYLVKDHCFQDGNKRIGWIAAMAVLASLGLTIRSTDEDAIDFVQGIASNEISGGRDVVQWLADRLELPSGKAQQ